jgi:hypothetical protein
MIELIESESSDDLKEIIVSDSRPFETRLAKKKKKGKSGQKKPEVISKCPKCGDECEHPIGCKFKCAKCDVELILIEKEKNV